MLILNPTSVRFDDLTWGDVATIAIERSAQRIVEEWTDLGPFAAFVDVPEQRVAVKVIRRLLRGDLDAPIPGREGSLRFCVAPAAADGGLRRITMPRCVVTGVKYDLDAAKQSAVQTISLIAHAKDGDDEPIETTDGSEAEE